MRVSLLLLGLLAACAPQRAAEDWADWYESATPYDVLEPVEFTDVPYDFPAAGGAGIDSLVGIPEDFETAFAPEDAPPEGCADWVTDTRLPIEVEGMVTVHPRFYYKTSGCGGGDEKYYGSYFVQDATGGIFVLGDSKVAHFDMGDRVRVKVRAVGERFELVSVAAHDVLEVERGPFPIYYEVATEAFSADDSAIVKRIEGTVTTDPDTFGEFEVESDEGVVWSVGLDVELNRRGVSYPVGARIRATGPILYSYSVYTLVVMRVGQIEEL